jgi:hypothetical protein
VRALLVLATVLGAAVGFTPAAHAAPCETIVGWVGIPLCQDAPAGDEVTVPDVVGEASFAAADLILEGLLLDGLDLGAVCSPAAASEIVSQAPPAGTIVPSGTLVALTASSGVACSGSGFLFLFERLEAGKQ